MNMELAFRSIFKNFKNTCYIIEFDLDTECVDGSDTCLFCAGSGTVIKKISKTQAVIDAGIMVAGSPRNLSDTDIGNHYKDVRVCYFLKDEHFDLSVSISRVLLYVIDGQISDVFNLQYMKPIVVNDKIIYYEGSITRNNINSTKHIEVYKTLIKDR